MKMCFSLIKKFILLCTLDRYYLLVKTKPNDFVDVQAMTKKACIMVWVVALPILVCSRIVVIGTLSGKSFPKVPKITDVDHWVLVGAMIISMFFYNIPDFMSILVYIKMCRYFSKRSQSVHPDPTIEEPGFGDLHMPVPGIQNYAQQNQASEARAVIGKLRVHFFICLLDMGYFVLNALLVRTVAGSIAVKIYMVVICFWLPMLVVKTNVKQLDGIFMYVWELIILKIF